MNTDQVYYRYSEQRISGGVSEWGDYLPSYGVQVYLVEYEVVKVTPKCVRLVTGKLVRKQARKRYACPTKAEAMQSFIARKTRQLTILQDNVSYVKEALKQAKSMETKLNEAF